MGEQSIKKQDFLRPARAKSSPTPSIPQSFFQRVCLPSASARLTCLVNLHALLQAHIPLEQGLQSLHQHAPKSLKKTLSRLIHALCQGHSLTEAMHQSDLIRYPVLLAIMQTGEETGNLPQALKQCITYLETCTQQHNRLKRALMYPMTVGVVLLVILFFFFTTLLSPLMSCLEMMDGSPNLSTHLLLQCARHGSTLLWSVGGSLILLVLTLLGTRLFPSWGILMDRWKGAFPFFGKIWVWRQWHQFFTILTTLLRANIFISSAFPLATEAILHRGLKKTLQQAQKKMQHETEWLLPLSQAQGIPPMVRQFLMTAQNLSHPLPLYEQIENFYAQALSTSIERLQQLLPATCLCLLGLMLGIVIHGTLFPLYTHMTPLMP